MKSLENRKWNSLSQLKDYLMTHHPKESIVSFNGETLVTTKYEYRLAFGQLSVKKYGK